ncbi:MAG: hypothetical protein JNL03_12255, partial [Prolixibacteraceae bacterium]|nr:hypothetical protein [Prolixibacteraceae bacterium]
MKRNYEVFFVFVCYMAVSAYFSMKAAGSTPYPERIELDQIVSAEKEAVRL